MFSETIKEIRTPGVRFREFLALNAEDEVQILQYENEIFSGIGWNFQKKKILFCGQIMRVLIFWSLANLEFLFP